MRALPAGVAPALLLLAAAASAQAPDPEPLRLGFRGAAGCPSASTFHDMVAAELGGKNPFVESAPERLVVGVRRLGPDYFVADAVLFDAAGKRTITTEEAAPTCAQALRLVAVEVASWRSPVLVAPPKPPPPPAPPAPEPPAPPPPPAKCEPAPEVVAPLKVEPPVKVVVWPDLAFRVGAGVWADLISTDRGSVGLTLDLGVRYKWFSVAGEARGDPAIGTTTYDDGTRMRFARVTGALLLCAHYEWLVSCVKGQAGELLFPGTFPPNRPQLYAAAGVRLGLEVPVAPPRFFLRLEGELLPPIDPASITNSKVTVFEVAGWNAGLGVGAMFAFGKR